MALVQKFEKAEMERNFVHKPVECTYSVFQDDAGGTFLQIDTYGSAGRKYKGKKSQSIQINRRAALALADIIRKSFS